MRSKLIPKYEYTKLIKMEIGQITRYLEETEYKREIDEFAIEYEGVELLEYALYKNLTRTLVKLKNITSDAAKVITSEYLKRKDVWNIKMILRGKYAGLSQDSIKKLLVPAGKLTEPEIDELMQKDSVNSIVESLKRVDLDYLRPGIDFFNKYKSLVLLENQLDIAYYREMIAFMRKVPEEGRPFKDFVLLEVDFLNMKNVLKMKLAEQEKSIIRSCLFYSGLKLKDDVLAELADTENIEGAVTKIEQGPYGQLLQPGLAAFRKSGNLTEVDLIMERYLLGKADFMPHTRPLSINSIIGYLFAKEIEIKNLLKIIKAKQLGMPEGFIEEQIIAEEKNG